MCGSSEFQGKPGRRRLNTDRRHFLRWVSLPLDNGAKSLSIYFLTTTDLMMPLYSQTGSKDIKTTPLGPKYRSPQNEEKGILSKNLTHFSSYASI